MKNALVVIAGADNPEGRGRMVHAIKTAAALRDAGSDVSMYFHGAGVNWVEAFDVRDDRFTENYGPAFDAVKDLVAGACNFCALVRFDVGDAAERLGIPIVGSDGEHHTVADLLSSGVTVTTF